jgi:hypothetical protein
MYQAFMSPSKPNIYRTSPMLSMEGVKVSLSIVQACSQNCVGLDLQLSTYSSSYGLDLQQTATYHIMSVTGLCQISLSATALQLVLRSASRMVV